jgi:hypothetical protein
MIPVHDVALLRTGPASATLGATASHSPKRWNFAKHSIRDSTDGAVGAPIAGGAYTRGDQGLFVDDILPNQHGLAWIDEPRWAFTNTSVRVGLRLFFFVGL